MEDNSYEDKEVQKSKSMLLTSENNIKRNSLTQSNSLSNIQSSLSGKQMTKMMQRKLKKQQ
jgi:hypothetical protein